MDSFQLVAILITLTAVLSLLNHSQLKLHPTVGIMLLSLLSAAIWVIVEHFWPAARSAGDLFRSSVDLNAALFHWMLASLLFAGALNVDVGELRHQRTSVAVLAVLGTVLSASLIAGGAFFTLKFAGHSLPLLTCAIFGVVISPTDPVAVLGFMKTVDAPKNVRAIIGGESLFNDGVGVVLFSLLIALNGGHHAGWMTVLWQFIRAVLGGAGIGFGAGLLAQWLLRRQADFQVGVLLTLSLALGGYALADAVHVSGPIAAVVAGLVIGHQSTDLGVPARGRLHLLDFWDLVDETLNAVLFLMIGLIGLNLTASLGNLAIQAGAVILVLLSRWLSVWLSAAGIRIGQQPKYRWQPGTITLLTWGGLRGGLALAMALSLKANQSRALIVPAVFGVVVFSTLVQATTLPLVFRRGALRSPVVGGK